MRVYQTVDARFLESEVIDYLNNCRVSPDDYDIEAVVNDCLIYLADNVTAEKTWNKLYIDYIPGDIFTDILQKHDVSEA